MLALGFSNWTYWETYNPPQFLGPQKVTFDGPNRIILVNEGETELDFREDVYSAWKEWVRDPTVINSGYAPAISAIGGDPLPGDRALGTTYFLENGWKMRTWEGDHTLTVNGNFFTREGDPPFVPTLRPATITINLNTSTLVENPGAQDASVGAGDLINIANAVWTTDAGDNTTALQLLENVPVNVWLEIIDAAKQQSAGDKLKAIATKSQDIALS